MHADVTPRRRWSARALSVCLVSVFALVVALTVGTDVVRVWLQHEPSWLIRPAQLDWLTRQQWGDLGTRLGSASLIVIGLMLLAAAVLPGNRKILPVRSPGKTTPVFLEKLDAVRALRTAAMRDHVVAARVRLSRRRARVKVRIVATNEAEERSVLERVETAVQDRFRSFGLVRPTRLVFRAKTFRPVPPKIQLRSIPLHDLDEQPSSSDTALERPEPAAARRDDADNDLVEHGASRSQVIE